MVDGAGLLGTGITHATAEHPTERTTTAATEELREEVLGVHTTAATTTLETFFTELVIDATLLGVGQNFVGVRQFLELLSGLGVVGILICTGTRND